MSTELVIRNATSKDAELLTELGARTFEETFAADNTDTDMSAYLAVAFNVTQQEKELSDPDRFFKIAEIDGLPVGYALLRAGNAPAAITGDRPVELVRLYVSQSVIGGGVGAALMKACLDESASRGFETIWLGVWEHNQRAQAFYRKWQFVEVGTHVFLLGNDEQRDLLMQKSLVSS